MADESIRGRFLWHELLTSDPAAGQSFYTALVGWGTQTEEMPMGAYTMFTQGETPMAGVMELPAEAKAMGAPPHWLTYLGTLDVDATAAQAKTLGGQVLVEPFDVPEVGRIAVLADPQGAALGVFRSAGDPPPPADPGAGSAVWHELATSDAEAGLTFYEELFGWEKRESMDMGDGNIYQMYGLDRPEPLGGIFNKPPEMPVAAWTVYWEVADVDAAATQIVELGGQVLNGPMEVPGGGRIVQGMDPQGAAFSLHTAPAE